MLSMTDILIGGARLINSFIREEHRLQGHDLTGEASRSLDYKISQTARQFILEGTAVSYMKIVDQGLEPDQIKSSMIPKLETYFVLRGLPPGEAKNAALATYFAWKKEGMSTQASKRYSQTGARQNFIESAFIGHEPEIDSYFINAFDFNVEEEYRKTKSETI